MSTLIFVGELNPYGQDPFYALYHLPRNASGNRLREHVGLTDVAYARLAKANLCTGRWSLPAARDHAAQLLPRYRVVVCLGAKVREAFAGPPFFAAYAVSDTSTLLTLPHPSGLNRMWGQPGAREQAREALQRVAPWVEWGEIDRPEGSP